MKISKASLAIVTLLTASAATASVVWAIANHSHEDGDYSHPEESKNVRHGGGLDQCGGHYNRKTGVYHYHQRKC